MIISAELDQAIIMHHAGDRCRFRAESERTVEGEARKLIRSTGERGGHFPLSSFFSVLSTEG